MIRSCRDLALELRHGTLSRLADDSGAFRWVVTDTDEPVHGNAIRAFGKRHGLTVTARDLTGEPMQLAAQP